MESPFSDYGKVVLAAWAALDTPLCATLKDLYLQRRWVDLLSIKVAPGSYTDSETYFRDAQAVALVRKLDLKLPGINTKQKALDKMLLAEKRCASTNVRFARYLENGPFEDPSELRCLSILELVREKVMRIMGPCPSWEQIHPRFGPGAVVETVKGRVTPLDKISVRPTTYPSARFLEHDWYATAWARSLGYDSAPIEVRGERFSTVRKDWDIDRTIGVGASLPVYYQLGVGKHLRRRLRQFGIDLDTGQATHRQVAKCGSRRGSSATIDLVSASDTIARNAVRYVSSDTWYQLLDSLRAPVIEIGGAWYRLERFSSMGNGFTFELQTIFFLAIALVAVELSGEEAVAGKTVHVYGDDIIVPTKSYPTVSALLRYFGCEPNAKKSFGEGPFRESCGGDFWNGEVVRPHYQKELPHEPAEWIALANGLRRAALARWGGPGPLLRAWLKTLDQIPSEIRKCRGPTSLGDIVIHDDPAHWNYTVRCSRRYFRCWRPVSRQVNLKRYSGNVVYAYALAGYPERLIPRDGVEGFRFGRICRDIADDGEYPNPKHVDDSVNNTPVINLQAWRGFPIVRSDWPPLGGR